MTMYNVFTALDKLINNVEGAVGMPVGQNCLVKREETLALLDEIRGELPKELDDAQDVLDKQEDILDAATAEADRMVGEATAEANQTIEDAQREADAISEDANLTATNMINEAKEEADRIVVDAQARADDMVARATEESERLISKGNAAYERSVEEGLNEQQRLVSESEVVQRANEEARRIVDKAHAESDALRSQCDEFVDSKLAEFEETLSATLRVVTRDRSALRRGAGASGESYGRSGDRSSRDQGARRYSADPDYRDRDYGSSRPYNRARRDRETGSGE